MERVPNTLVYRRVRENVRMLTRHRTVADKVVPACPDWTVRELVAHLGKVCATAFGREWAEAPAPEPPGESAGIPELLAHWEKLAGEFEQAVARGVAEMDALLIADAVVHEGDIRVVAGQPMPAGHPAFMSTMDLGIWGFSQSLISRGLPALSIESGDLRWVAGEGEPAATVRGGLHDLIRSFAGRRTYQQIAGLSWSTDPGPWHEAFTWGPFTPPAAPIE
ncbi:hypothetical protein [Microbispora sp. NBC_01389]|uniref:hypothetical protein n=1 Tax=Microbispora sp. NBC_01389 TaxID=2903584 RepID=UPI003253C825